VKISSFPAVEPAKDWGTAENIPGPEEIIPAERQPAFRAAASQTQKTEL
jgi:hypothetical protein